MFQRCVETTLESSDCFFHIIIARSCLALKQTIEQKLGGVRWEPWCFSVFIASKNGGIWILFTLYPATPGCSASTGGYSPAGGRIMSNLSWMIVRFSMCHHTATFLKRDENTNAISTVQNFHSMKKKQVFTPIVPPIAFNEFCKLPICTPSWTYTDSNCGLLCIQIYSIKLRSPTTDIRWWYKPKPIYCG